MINSTVKDKNYYLRNLTIGVVLMISSIFLPLFVNAGNFNIYNDIYHSISSQDIEILTYATLKLVLLNILRSLPHYVGAFFIRESLNYKPNTKNGSLLNTLVVVITIPMVYLLILLIHGIKYDFGISALFLILLIIMFEKADFSHVSGGKKTALVVLITSAMQFLDIMPMVPFFGKGELSMDIKAVIWFLGKEVFIQQLFTGFFVLFLLSAFLLFMMILDENQLKILMEEKRESQEILANQRIRAQQERTQLELRHLVHDLKTPLTTGQALISLLKLSHEREGLQQNVDYLARVEMAIEQMSDMISEILYETKRTVLTTKKLMDILLAQISDTEYAVLVKTENLAEDIYIEVNEIRFVRALVNLIENAFYSLENKKSAIKVMVNQEEDWVCFSVKDRGRGIPVDQLGKIWKDGYSTRESSGLGLSFVEKVVTSNSGRISIKSQIDMGTEVKVLVPIFLERGKQDE